MMFIIRSYPAEITLSCAWEGRALPPAPQVPQPWSRP